MTPREALAAVLARCPRAHAVNGIALYREDDLLAAATQIDNPPARTPLPAEGDQPCALHT